MRKKYRQMVQPLLRLIIALTLILIVIAAIGNRPAKKDKHWQLSPQAQSPDFSDAASGFQGVGFYDENSFDAGNIYFLLTRNDESELSFAYVPAEMNAKALHLRMNPGESLRIEAADRAALGDLDLPGYITSLDGTELDTTEGALPGTFRAGDQLPYFTEGAPYSFTLLDSDGQETAHRTVVFLYSENVPSMYINTESGSMDAINKDRHHETSESAEYRICLTDGSPDAAGLCTIKGRGNSTWSQSKRPYNLKLDQENTLLEMDGCTKYALIANFWDSTQTRQYYAFKAASELGLEYPPREQFVNLYLNGRYQSLYLLTQRINVNGGTVRITDLDKKNQKANPNPDLSADHLQEVVLDRDEKGFNSVALAWPNEPADLSGGYLIEFNARYKDEPYWFQTETLHMSFKSPQEPSVGESRYITSYVREAEAALFQTDTASGRSVWEYFDMDSWARMYLIQDFFVQSDDEFYSFYFYKKNGDPLLYCGPVWDFDLCLGNMNSGDYYRTSAQTLWLRDGRKRWLNRMDQYPEFRERVAQIYLDEFEPIIRNLMDEEYDATVERLEKITGLNYLRWRKSLNYREKTDLVRTLLNTRVQFLHDYYTDPGSFHRLLFHFDWDDMSYYVRDGESMHFLPTEDYGEKQSGNQKKANGLITGWQDTATGALLQPDEPIYTDREFDPVYASE